MIERLAERVIRTNGRPWTVRRPFLTVLAATLVGTTPLEVSCSGPLHRASVGPTLRAVRSLAPDSTVIIIRVVNPQLFDVTVLLDSPYGPQRIGEVTSLHESIFVLPTTAVAAITEFAVTVVRNGTQENSYKTGVITRAQGKITLVAIVVGRGPKSSGHPWSDERT